jgi:hypothetical protein
MQFEWSLRGSVEVVRHAGSPPARIKTAANSAPPAGCILLSMVAASLPGPRQRRPLSQRGGVALATSGNPSLRATRPFPVLRPAFLFGTLVALPFSHIRAILPSTRGCTLLSTEPIPGVLLVPMQVRKCGRSARGIASVQPLPPTTLSHSLVSLIGANPEVNGTD